MLGTFVKGPGHITFITAEYEYSTQNSFFVKAVCRNVWSVNPVDAIKNIHILVIWNRKVYF